MFVDLYRNFPNSKGAIMNPEILYEDQDILICRKPAKTAVQNHRASAPDMVSILKNYLYRNQKHKKEPYLAVIHRLDQPVEGLLVFAKTKHAAKELNRQLTEMEFGKYYLALLENALPDQEGVLTDYLIKDSKTNSSRICTKRLPGAKKAVLHYRLVPSQDGKHLYEIKLETGRHHQIRVQMAAAGCPIVGDAKYNPNSHSPGQWAQIALCAYKLEFSHPVTEKKISFQITPSFLSGSEK